VATKKYRIHGFDVPLKKGDKYCVGYLAIKYGVAIRKFTCHKTKKAADADAYRRRRSRPMVRTVAHWKNRFFTT